jgi:hypothetical protein
MVALSQLAKHPMKFVPIIAWFSILSTMFAASSSSIMSQNPGTAQPRHPSSRSDTANKLSLAQQQNSTTSDKARREPKAVEIELNRFQPPTEDDKKQIEQWLLELDLVPLLADRVAFAATGTVFFAGKGDESQISNLRQFAIGWSLDNREDRERLMVINQPLLAPITREQDMSQIMHSNTSQLDQLRIKRQYHEASGLIRLESGPTSKLRERLERANTFFPTRAATSSPIASWQGRSIDRSNPTVTIDRLQGIQRIGAHTVALFEFRPADFYVFLVGIAFLDGSPVQCDSWRQFRRANDIENAQPTPEQSESQRLYVRSNATRVARVQSIWQKTETHSVPVWIHGVTLNDAYDVELLAEIRWYVNDQVNPLVFQLETLQQLGPLAVSQDQAAFRE